MMICNVHGAPQIHSLLLDVQLESLQHAGAGEASYRCTAQGSVGLAPAVGEPAIESSAVVS